MNEEGEESVFTWVARLWSMNDENTYHLLHDRAKDLTLQISSRQHCIQILADEIRAQLEEIDPCAGEASIFSDLMTRALAMIDYQAVAEQFFDE